MLTYRRGLRGGTRRPGGACVGRNTCRVRIRARLGAPRVVGSSGRRSRARTLVHLVEELAIRDVALERGGETEDKRLPLVLVARIHAERASEGEVRMGGTTATRGSSAGTDHAHVARAPPLAAVPSPTEKHVEDHPSLARAEKSYRLPAPERWEKYSVMSWKGLQNVLVFDALSSVNNHAHKILSPSPSLPSGLFCSVPRQRGAFRPVRPRIHPPQFERVVCECARLFRLGSESGQQLQRPHVARGVRLGRRTAQHHRSNGAFIAMANGSVDPERRLTGLGERFTDAFEPPMVSPPPRFRFST